MYENWIILILVIGSIFERGLVQGDRQGGSAFTDEGGATAKGEGKGENVGAGGNRDGWGGKGGGSGAVEGGTTKTSLEDMDKALTAKMEKLINSKEGHYIKNKEYASLLEALIKASKWPKETYLAKQLSYDIFEQYNHRRLELEEQIDDRLLAINIELHSQTANPDCLMFYLKQKEKLEKAYIKTNAQKENALTKNSKPCPFHKFQQDDNIDDDVHDDDVNDNYNNCNDNHYANNYEGDDDDDDIYDDDDSVYYVYDAYIDSDER